ncbi:LysR family transcriptional regulator [Enterovirga rhinocerotis]|uniref:DNA-binding transcriptional LysR family regulator n=1 Tax=Enterovirga rhinocerotis TaxID=1339210 RepID=A0A4R7BY84_9HYPH|nr:LysR family transcriptional regulator [Enterovirga rhinocerotis]TDR90212.1 DNA-binding transcriptional LysR family regulator [Enterovirga rhinocerotis]
MQINLKTLAAFLSVAETGSFRKAADVVRRSQSAVSMQIKQLEDQLGLVLFHRTTRRVQLTAEGEVLLGSARRALAELKTGLESLREAADMQTGQLSLGCVPSVAATMLPPILALYQRDFPRIRVTLRELASDDLLQAVARRDVEFGIGPGVAWAGDFAFRPFASDPILALVPKAFDTPERDEITLADLARLPVLMYSRSAALRGNLEREMAARGLTFDIRYEILHAQTLVAFARAGLGVAVLPKVTVPPRLGKGLRALPIVDPRLERSLDIITLRGQALSPAAQRLADLVAARFERRDAGRAGTDQRN